VLIRRAGSPVTTSVTFLAGRAGADAVADDRKPGVAAGRACSERVENSPHFGHRPYHWADVAPHAEHR
jgi:hypothetical protein